MSILHPLPNQVKRPSVSIFPKERGKKSQKQEKLATTYLNLANTKMATFAKLNLQGLLWNKDHHRDKDLQERAPTVLGQEFLIREKKNLLKKCRFLKPILSDQRKKRLLVQLEAACLKWVAKANSILKLTPFNFSLANLRMQRVLPIRLRFKRDRPR